ncbi:hypothetical protein V5O48_000598 [Marasmius crinis-equi]|uniref:Uncharacterized protein n=1 Tax=Marasmius crinis-equi TaxID=585013 RepID=A0ABR3G0U0_9AGAR
MAGVLPIPDLEDDLKRTITIVIWYNVRLYCYQTNTEPLRLQQIAPQFPLFQLSRLSTLVNDLGLTENSYLDTYNHQLGRWEQHTISTIRVVESNQRLLYRIRRSLLNGLHEDECLTLADEIDLQPPPSSPSNKRVAPEDDQTQAPPKKKATPHVISAAPNATPSSSTTPVTATDKTPPTSPTPALTLFPKSPDNEGGYVYQTQGFYTTPAPEVVTLPMHLVNPPVEPAPIPYHPHPPLKRWPNDYTVSQLAHGFGALEALCSHSHVMVITPEGERVSVTTPNMSQKLAFERVFGSRYVKSTVCRHRGVWRRAPREIRIEFESYGDDERGSWGEFVRRVEGKPPGKSAHAHQQQAQLPPPQIVPQIMQPNIPHNGQVMNIPSNVTQMALPGHENLIFHSPDLSIIGNLPQQAQQPPRENGIAEEPHNDKDPSASAPDQSNLTHQSQGGSKTPMGYDCPLAVSHPPVGMR